MFRAGNNTFSLTPEKWHLTELFAQNCDVAAQRAAPGRRLLGRGLKGGSADRSALRVLRAWPVVPAVCPVSAGS